MTSTDTGLVEAPTKCRGCGYPVGIGADGLCKECGPNDEPRKDAESAALKVKVEYYRGLGDRIQASEEDALLARWEFGGALLSERDANGGKKLPDGRLEELADALAIGSRTELKNRMQFAAEHPTEDEALAALAEHGSWHEICRRGLGDRSAGTGPRPEPHANNYVIPERCHIPERLRPRVDPIRAAIRSEFYEDAVEALLDYVESDRKRWERWAKARQSAPRGDA